jgi:AAA ATPase domain
MTERLIIRKFAGIEELDIQIKQFTVLIGPQATGKSICAKLLYFFKNFITDIIESLEELDYGKQFVDRKSKARFIECFPPESWGSQDFLIRYENTDSYMEITRLKSRDGSIRIAYSENYKKLILSFKKIKFAPPQKTTSAVRFEKEIELQQSRILKQTENIMGESFLFSQMFIPAGRSFFTIVQRSLFSFLSQRNELDPFLISFGSLYQFVKRFHNRLVTVDHRIYVDKITDEIIAGQYREVNGEDFLQMNDDRLISLSSASSGQQEALPLVLILTSLPMLRGLFPRKTVYIEEPEAHIFPDGQRSLVQLIAAAFNAEPNMTQVFITTHSPYVLTTINNLLQGGELYEKLTKKSDLKKLEKIIDKRISLSADSLAVYALTGSGVTNILSGEFGLIDTNIIDEVANEMAIEFGQLLDLVD